MKTSAAAIIMFAVAAFVGALGQYFYQSGAERAGDSWRGYVLNVRLWGGVLCYIAVMLLFVAGFKKGGALTVLYPVYATTFIWAAMLAWCFHGQTIRLTNVAGMLLLLAGMYFIGR
jgi:drug/metabolite transporter (DMT)-like permease